LAAPPQHAQAGLFSISPEQEKKLGAQAAREIESKARIVRGPVADWVNIVGQRLASVSKAEWKYSFKVIDSPEVNAFALPGGYVYVFTGLRKVAQTDDELAAVLAHEITHAENHHYAQQYKKASTRGALLSVFSLAVGLPNYASQIVGLIDYSMTQKYSRTHEYESDRLGVERMVRAGFDPRGMVSLLEKMSKEDRSSGTLIGWMRSHPEGRARVEAVQRTIAEVKAQQAQNNPAVKPKYAPWTSETLQQLAYPGEAAPPPSAETATP
jgi:predicted Zn-dependent protease